jgi:hypothetical protein
VRVEDLLMYRVSREREAGFTAHLLSQDLPAAVTEA